VTPGFYAPKYFSFINYALNHYHVGTNKA